jgi:phosphoserine aminotransferase
MVQRLFNFSAGPGCLPEVVLEEARENLLSLGNTGIGILECSHRSKAFEAINAGTEALLKKLLGVPDDFSIMFLQGGASTQFSMIPMNILAADQTADYIVTGAWAQKAVKEAKLFGKTHIASSSEDRNFCYLPKTQNYSASPAYIHYTSNNTIFGTQFATEPTTPTGIPVVCDASSDICSRPLDMTKYDLIYAGAQKNLGPSGVTIVIMKNELIEKAPKNLPTMSQYRTHAKEHSMYNTPPTFGIYIVGLVLKWIDSLGGLEKVEQINKHKAGLLYTYLEQSKLFNATADKDSRSLMNVTFVTGKEDLDTKFCKEATAAGFDGLKGHRSVGGMRASIYNAFPTKGVEQLVQFMQDFEAKNA